MGGNKFSRTGDSPKWVKSKRRRKRRRRGEKERLNDGNNNGQATHGARKHAWRTQARIAHASRLGQKASVVRSQLLPTGIVVLFFKKSLFLKSIDQQKSTTSSGQIQT